MQGRDILGRSRPIPAAERRISFAEARSGWAARFQQRSEPRIARLSLGFGVEVREGAVVEVAHIA
jgi:hypothetical protein